IGFITAGLYGSPFWRSLIQTSLFAACCAMLAPNLHYGVVYAADRVAIADSLREDVAAGMPVRQIAQRHPRVFPNEARLERFLAQMQQARLGPFAEASRTFVEPRCHEQPFAGAPVLMNQAVVHEDNLGESLGDDPYLVYALPAATKVCGIRMEFDLDNRIAAPPMTQMFWKNAAAGEEFDGQHRNATLATHNARQTATFWVYATIDHFRFDPDIRPGAFRVRAITLLVEDAP
ncbi:MAG TPA: hypothetical protein VF132_04085, partial [Rudaea sp.]